MIGLDVLTQTARFAQLGIAVEERVLLELEKRPGVHALTSKRLGLYHTALLLPSRAALASFAEHLQRHGIRAGSSNHLVSEAFYLEDLDGLTIEVYADCERHQWPWRDDKLEIATLPLNVENLSATPHIAWEGVPRDTTMGHIHLYIGDLERARRLYQQGLGMSLQTRDFPGALFLAAGDYHHHLGLNTWAGSAPIASEQDARLLWWELRVPEQHLFMLREQMSACGWQLGHEQGFLDPWGIYLRVSSTTEPLSNAQ